MSSSIELHTIDPVAGRPATTLAVVNQVPNATSKAIQNRNYLIAVKLFFAFLGGVGGRI